MTKGCSLVFVLLLAAAIAFAQQSPSPGTSASASATATVAPTGTAAPSPTAPARTVRISFVPPPLEGRITLGIYSHDGKLVRTLVREGAIDEFEVGADALVMKWNGKDDADADLPAGKYHARGYMVGELKVEDIGTPNAAPPAGATDRLQVKLVANPLSKDAKLNLDIVAAYDDEQIILKTGDGLPLYSVIESPELKRIVVTKNGEKAIDVWADNGEAIDQVRVSNIDQMMGFDCGEVELK
jgi:hypothetical protein